MFCMYKMVVITVQNYTDAKVCTITVRSRELSWLKMIGVQNKLGIKSLSDLVKKEFKAFLKLKTLQKSKLENINVLKNK